jgi:hypothetical protein
MIPQGIARKITLKSIMKIMYWCGLGQDMVGSSDKVLQIR